MDRFQLTSDFQPTGDQPQAIDQLAEGLKEGYRHQTLLGVTGSGKTFSLANVIARWNRPTLVISHNKTLAAQLYQEFRDFFPHNAVEYFVSYYDYYQPEAYVPQIDLYIEKDATINQEIERLRNAATQALISRRDVIIVASVSCIYGLGDPEDYRDMMVDLRVGEVRNREKLLRQLIAMQYARTNADLAPGKFRVQGDVVEIQQSGQEVALRLEFWGDSIERLTRLDPVTGELLAEPQETQIFPARHYMVSSEEKFHQALADIEEELQERLAELEEQDNILEAHRLEQRTRYDLEMMREMGYCTGIENYSRHLDQRPPGSAPSVLLDYFPDDFLLVVDESHITLPQVRGMFHGDRNRKQTLVDFGFRLPSAVDNRPLTWDEFEGQTHQVIYTSATPSEYELQTSDQVVEQLIRPTGIVDPAIHVRPSRGQIDDLIGEIRRRVAVGQRTLVTTLTKRMAEDLADYLMEMGVKVHYLHSEVQTLERVQILRDLRRGVYDVVVGINLLREGLDLPEVSLVAILDADKEGFLRSGTSLIQTIGRAARHVDGTVIMYAEQVTDSMSHAIAETERRRQTQIEYNERHGIVPRSIVKEVRDITDRVRQEVERKLPVDVAPEELSREELHRLVAELEREMKAAAAELEFEKAAALRDQIFELRRMAQTEEDAERMAGLLSRATQETDG